MRATTLALCLLSLGVTSYAHEDKAGVEFRATTRSTGGCPPLVEWSLSNGEAIEFDDAAGCTTDRVRCATCPECIPAAGLSVVVAQGLTLEPGRYRVLFGGSRAFFDVTGPMSECLLPGGCVYRIARLSDTPSCPEPECVDGLRLQVDSAVDEERVQRVTALALPGSFRRGVLTCEQQEVWP